MTVPTATFVPCQELGAEEDVGGSRTDRRDVVARGDRAALADLVEGQLGSQEGMVDGLGDPVIGEVVDGQGAHTKMMARDRKHV